MQDLYRAVVLFLVLLIGSAARCADFGDEISAVATDHATRVQSAKQEFDQEVRRSTAIAIGRLESIARSATRSGSLAAATDAWRYVLQYDSSHAEARAHFAGLGRLEEVLQEIEADPTASPTLTTDAVVVDYGQIPVQVVELAAGLSYFRDLEYTFVDIPRALQGYAVTQLQFKQHGKKPVTINVPKGQSVFVFCDHRTSTFVEVLKAHQALATNGFEKIGAVVTTDNRMKAFLVFRKRAGKPETISLPVSRGASIVARSLVDANAK